MDFEDNPDEASFRAEARAWLAEHTPGYVTCAGDFGSEEDMLARTRAWLRRKKDAGYATITWPREAGGLGGTPMQEVIFAQEEGKYDVPSGAPVNRGIHMALPAIARHGTAVQYARFAEPTLTGEMLWCQLFSEPGAGSDLAALRTRAVKDGDRWIVTGQKVWSSGAHYSDWGILLARTDWKVPKHKGISLFLLDMRSAGVEIRPIRQIDGSSEFNEVFLTDVHIPDNCLVGRPGDGWAAAMTVLMNERAVSGDDSESFVLRLMERARSAARQQGSALDEGMLRGRLARWYAQEQGLKYFGYRLLTATSKGQATPPSAALVKLVSATKLQETYAQAMDIDDFAGVFIDPACPEQRDTFQGYLWGAVMRIGGGTDEILRNQIAERVLGLPGEIRMDKDVPFEDLRS